MYTDYEDGRSSSTESAAISDGKIVPLVPNHARQWTLKGIPQDTVEISREAARLSGMKLNSWVGKALMSAANPVVEEAQSPSDTELARRVVELEEYIRHELSSLREQQGHIESTMNGISSMLIKMYAKNS